MNQKIHIRFTKKADLAQLPWLYRQYHNGDSKLMTNEVAMYKKFDVLSRRKDYVFVSAVHEETLVGFCSVVVNHDIVEQQKPILMLWNLRVHPDYRNQHIGEEIMHFIENYGKQIGADFIFLGCDADNQRARNFYHKIGYQEDYAFYKYL